MHVCELFLIFALENIKDVANIHKNIVTCKKFNIFFVILHKKVRHTIKNCRKNMSLSEIKQLVSVAFQAGRMDAQFEMGLRSDRIRRKDAECYLASKGFEKQMIDKWVKNRLMKEYVGDSKNSPRYYSLKEINELVVSCQIKKMII